MEENKGLAHGSASTYSNHKCRCDDCKRAWASYSRKYSQKYYLNNLEKARKQRRDYMRRNKGRQTELENIWKDNNKERIREVKRRYYLKNKDKINAQHREWRRVNKLK